MFSCNEIKFQKKCDLKFRWFAIRCFFLKSRPYVINFLLLFLGKNFLWIEPETRYVHTALEKFGSLCASRQPPSSSGRWSQAFGGEKKCGTCLLLTSLEPSPQAARSCHNCNLLFHHPPTTSSQPFTVSPRLAPPRVIPPAARKPYRRSMQKIQTKDLWLVDDTRLVGQITAIKRHGQKCRNDRS